MSPARTLTAAALAATLTGCATLSTLCHPDARPGALDRAELHPPQDRLLVALGVMLAECLWPVDAP